MVAIALFASKGLSRGNVLMSTNNSGTSLMQDALVTSLRAHWKLSLAEGIILLLMGLTAILLPLIATIAVEILIGWLFLISGIVGLITTFRMRRAPAFWWSLLSAILGVAVGIALIRWPLGGALTLTLMLTLFFVFEGVVSIMYALEHKRELSGRWAWMLVSGIVDLVLAGIIFLGLPGTATWAIGLLVGINLIFGGTALIGMALHASSVDPRAGVHAR